MKIGIPKEIYQGEKRVAIVPKAVTQLLKDGHEVFIEARAGEGAYFPDAEYEQAGAVIVKDAQLLYSGADVIMKVQPPQRGEFEMMKSSSTYIGFLSSVLNAEFLNLMNGKNITSFVMEFIPRTSRSQSMDALSSMAGIAGYRGVLIAAQYLGKFFPLMMTAAGTIPPAKVLVIGAGVAGLQAIATARRLGARVEAFDTRPAVREQVESLRAKFVEMELVADAETASGYAKEMTEDFMKKEREIIGDRATQNHVVITTAQLFGKRAPILITEEMVKKMQKGSVIIDLAAEQGGNCEITEPGKNICKHGVTICGVLNLPSTLPIDASNMYSRNITQFFKHLYMADDRKLDFEDKITKSSCVTYNGEIVNDYVRKAIRKGADT
ncbi:MAG: Re/Si-specific NAD(P)(+) transhydrogenase subunit alpha [Candidatus Scalindua rubra]|uniref:NAD(P) transhydrogenase subunit alpha part 1 n=1 Tax=Candidatus Scalindua brodae TaxID=237368 RepID=A0A0B0ELF6_9BACT|nr:MAG: alanine dehydrogenase [Candidatus Scalindua brodae]MBZ0108144.1 Re/Si-specific NAD(P)(+) transhydrogenase subunit alpha [Candidatus Scalindua rubra]TWU31238.1 NAD(P) transhydrogenase subunit alpha part 1 [Candidatus Brocadiaceae bacterium S225]